MEPLCKVLLACIEHLIIQGSLDQLVYWKLAYISGRSREGVAAQYREVFGYAGVEWGTKEAVGDSHGMGERGFANVN